MALNYSSRSLLVTDECANMMLGCGCWSDEASPVSSSGVNSLWWNEPEMEMKEADPVDLLPTDPFGMNLETTFTAAIASCIGDLTFMSGAGHFGSGDDDDFSDDLSYYLNQAFMLTPEPWSGAYTGGFEDSFVCGGLSGAGGMEQFSRLPPSMSYSIGVMEDPYSSCHPALSCCDNMVEEDPSSSCNPALACWDMVDVAPVQEGNDAHEAMVFVLSYLGLRDILSVEMVCKSLHSAVRNEPFLWKCIHIDSRLGKKMSDADLLCLTQKSPGSMQCLSLMHCNNITDQGLKAVLKSNLQLTKLGIFGAFRITYQGLIDSLRSFNMETDIGIKKLRVTNHVTASEAQYEELLSLMKIDKKMALHKQEPRIFHSGRLLLDLYGGYVPDSFVPELHDEFALDIEKCPLCPNYKLVYDCPSKECKNSRHSTCRGCIVCIWRCLLCGRCIDIANVFQESFCLGKLCRDCVKYEDLLPTEK
ncbi:F-box protein SKIP14 [Zea mays]|uniref:F-box domain-containing protein n=2 Tax=Zea mays TaxID=4577 RepID=A0A804UMB5_MAIZE|nr:F-box protein SKIP14 [Zea mays]